MLNTHILALAQTIIIIAMMAVPMSYLSNCDDDGDGGDVDGA
jgi:hypothetical protein